MKKKKSVGLKQATITIDGQTLLDMFKKLGNIPEDAKCKTLFMRNPLEIIPTAQKSYSSFIIVFESEELESVPESSVLPKFDVWINLYAPQDKQEE